MNAVAHREPAGAPEGGSVQGWAGLARAQVARIERPRTEDELGQAVGRAAAAGLGVSLRGCGHASGGQSFVDGGTMIDVRGLDRILELDRDARTIRVQSGATLGALTRVLEPVGLGLATKQEFETFTIGGSLAANAHGKSIDRGPMIGAVRSLRLMGADGEIVEVSREVRPELLRGAVGGYGLLGVIVDATLELVEDQPVTNTERVFDDAGPLIARYRERVEAGRERTPLCYGFLDGDCRRGFYVAYTTLDDGRRRSLDELERHEPPPAAFNALVGLQRRSALVRRGTLRLMWLASRAPEETLRSRRLLLWDEPPKGLERTLLQKYIVPTAAFAGFVARAGEILRRHRRELPQFPPHFRFIPGGDEAMLPLAPEDSICLILCHLATPGSSRWRGAFERATAELLEACLDAGGRHYLTFDTVATREQVTRAYPRWDEFLALKRRHDPTELFTSSFYERYR